MTQDEKENNCMTCGIHRSEMQEIPWGRFVNRELFIQCKPCHAKEIQDQIDAFQKTEPDTTYESSVICPYCGAKHESDGDDYTTFYKEGLHEFTCGRCDNDFEIETMVSFSYSTHKKSVTP